MFVKEVGNYALPSYEKDRAGFILDFKHLAANRFFIQNAFTSNYRFALARIRDILRVSGHRVTHIIDVGAGSGVLTQAIVDLELPNVRVAGTEIRSETVECNSLLYPEIIWKNTSELPGLIAEYGTDHILIVMNGVVNFMTEDELRRFLSYRVKHIVWFYHTSVSDGSVLERTTPTIFSVEREGYIHYNLGVFLREYGYSFDFEFIPILSGGGFVSVSSTLEF